MFVTALYCLVALAGLTGDVGSSDAGQGSGQTAMLRRFSQGMPDTAGSAGRRPAPDWKTIIVWPPACCEESSKCYRRLRTEFPVSVVHVPYDHDNPSRYERALSNAHAAGWKNNRIRINVNCCDADRIPGIMSFARTRGDTTSFHSVAVDEPFFEHGSCPVCPPADARTLRNVVRMHTGPTTRFVIGAYLRWEAQWMGFSFNHPMGFRVYDRVIFDDYASAAEVFTYTKYQQFGLPTNDQRQDWTTYVTAYQSHAPEVCINLTTEEDEFEDLIAHADRLGVGTIEVYALEDSCETFFPLLEAFMLVAVRYGYASAVP